MNKILSILLTVSILIGLMTTVSASNTEWIAGDINSDGMVNMKDIVLLQQYLNGWDVTIDESVSDINEDYTIDMKDVVSLQKYMNKLSSLPNIPSISYKVHIENKSWLSSVKNGEIAGTTGESKRLEAIVINHSNIQYRVHVQNDGWLPWVSSGEVAGTVGKEKQIEAISIKLDEKEALKFDIYYRLHIKEYGWTGWAKNGEIAGSTGLNLRAEAIQINFVKKDTTVSSDKLSYLEKPKLTYKAHIQDLNWQKEVKEGEIAGTTGKSLRLEAFVINLMNFNGGNGVYYKVHVSDIGWQSWVSSGNIAGTEGQKKAVEAIQIKLSSSLEPYFDIYYRVHSKDLNWLGWAKNGESAGTTGGRKQIEAIQIKLLPKNSSSPGGGTPFYVLEEETTNNSFVYPMQNTYVCGNDWGEYYSARPSRPYHAGIDIASSNGNTNIYATANGVVDKCGWNSANGNYVVIKHSIGSNVVYSFYAHLSRYCVSVGTSVNSNTIIGIMGNTGSGSAGAHLHFAFMDTSWAGNYYGYIPYFTGNKSAYGGVTYYNPHYIVQNNQLP